MDGMDIREQNGRNEMITIKETPTIRCIKCGCVFEFDISDIKESTKTIREDVGTIIPIYKNIKYEIRYVDCPVCGYEIEIWSVQNENM